MKIVISLAIFFLSLSFVQAEDVYEIEMGRDYKRYSDQDLRRRVWELERAVWQLQRKVFDLEKEKKPEEVTWVCYVEAQGQTHSATGKTKALAKQAALEACKNAHHGSTFFCKDARCEN